MSTISLKDMQLDLEDSAAYFDSLSQFLEGHAIYLKAQRAVCRQEDLKLLESHAGSLATSVTYIRTAASRIARRAR